MNESQQRHLLMMFHHVDHLLSEAERILASTHSPSPFQEYTQDSTPAQRKMTHDYVLRVRDTMRRILDELKIPPKSPTSSALWAARNHLAFAGIAIVEIEPRHMKGYGELSEAEKQMLNWITAELNGLLDHLNNALAGGTDTH
ncbi:MAG: hypothetical protein WBS33_04475 [Verrucomicrobiia bacterium]